MTAIAEESQTTSGQPTPYDLANRGWHIFPADHPELPECAGPKSDQHEPTTCDQRGSSVISRRGASTSKPATPRYGSATKARCSTAVQLSL